MNQVLTNVEVLAALAAALSSGGVRVVAPPLLDVEDLAFASST